MRVKWTRCGPEHEYEHNVYILALWGNRRNIAIAHAEVFHWWHRRKGWCVTAWYNPLTFPVYFGL